MRTAALLFTLLASAAVSGNEGFAGKWDLTIAVPDAAPLVGVLELEQRDGAWHAWVENGPAPVEIDGDQIAFTIDSRDRQGFRFERRLQGRLEEGRISGVMRSSDVLPTAAEYGEDGSAWSAVRQNESRSGGAEYALADFDGTWIGIRGVDIRKYTMDLTDKASAWVTAYDARMDEPQKRCVSPGLVAATTWIFPFEVAVKEDRQRIIMLYEAFGLSRRIHLDPERMPEFYPESSMGYSKGRFTDGELIVETPLLTPSTRDFNGEPVGENATVVERYFLTDQGKRLNLVMHLHDPDNYNRPPIRRRAWDRNDDALIFPFECDPDSFFRQLFNEGRMQEYIDRAHMRP